MRICHLTTRSLGQGTTCAVLFQVPNQPITFAKDPAGNGRSEDALVAWTWYQFWMDNMTTPEQLVFFPMTKAGCRAMDAVEQ